MQCFYYLYICRLYQGGRYKAFTQKNQILPCNLAGPATEVMERVDWLSGGITSIAWLLGNMRAL